MSLFRVITLLFGATFLIPISLTASDNTNTNYASDTSNYVILKQLADKYGLQHERDQITGREIFSGNGTKMVVCSGMLTVMINNQITILKDRAKLINGEISIPAADFPEIESKLKAAQTEHVTNEFCFKKVVLDPGHGGDFTGARGRNGTLEKDINLKIALKLKALLEEKKIAVIMTRTTDIHLSPNLNEDLERRAESANREQPDLFISIHCNWTNQASIRGFEIYYCNEKPVSQAPKVKAEHLGKTDEYDQKTREILQDILRDEYKQETAEFAEEVKDSFNKLPTENRGIRQANFRVIKKTTCPSILVEVDFISNRTTAKQLSEDAYRQQIAQRLCESVLNYQQKIIRTEGFTK